MLRIMIAPAAYDYSVIGEALRLLTKHRAALDRVASALLQKETLGREEVLELLAGIQPESRASESVGTPGRSAHTPRTTRSTFTPAAEAR